MSSAIVGIVLGIFFTYFLVKAWVIMVSFLFNPSGRKWQKIINWAKHPYNDWDSVNGIGTRLYGHSEEAIIGSDTSFITTSYLCFILIPLVPLHEYRVIFRNKHRILFGSKAKYSILNTFQIDSKKYPLFKIFITPLALISCTSLIALIPYILISAIYGWIV